MNYHRSRPSRVLSALSLGGALVTVASSIAYADGVYVRESHSVALGGPNAIPAPGSAAPNGATVPPSVVRSGDPASNPFMPMATTPASALKLLAVTQRQQTLKEPVELSVENATLEDVVARIRKVLAARQVLLLPRVDTRGVKAIRLTFTAKKSTVGGVLNAAATLAGGKVWVLTDHITIAPESALSESEVEDKKNGLLTEVNTLATGGDPLGSQAKRSAFSNFIANEINKGDIAPKTQSASTGVRPGLTTPAEGMINKVTFDQLSPDAKAMLQELVSSSKNHLNSRGSRMNVSPFNLSSDAVIGASPDKNGSLLVDFADSVSHMHWDLNGMGWGSRSGSGPINRPESTSPAVAPIDPSAGKS